MFAPKTALGIDVSDGRINLAILKKSTGSVKLLKAATAPVPDGAIKNGNIEDAVVLAKAIKKLKAQNRIRSHPTAMSLLTNPVLMQILDMPDRPPGNLRQFVRDQVKHYAILPMNKAAIDFCGVGTPFCNKSQKWKTVKSAGSGGSQTPLFAFGDPASSRALVVATDNQKLTDAARILHREGLNLDAIEPASLAYIRACYAKKIEKKFDRNLLLAIADADILTLCLFKNQALDFIRTKHFEADIYHSDKYLEWLTEEIYTVIQFYELEVLDKRDKWEVTLITDVGNQPVKDETLSLGTNVEGVDLKIRTLRTAYLDTPVADTEQSEKPSAIAVGLAMKLLDNSKNTPDINLLPPQVAQAKTTEKQVLISANAAAVIFFLMIVSIGIFNLKAKKIQNDINQKAQAQEKLNMHALLGEQTSLNSQTIDVSDEINRLNAVLDAGSFKRWDQILNDIRSAIPKTVRLTRLSCESNSKMLLTGQAVSYEAIHRFVDMLNASKHIESTLFLGAEEESQTNALLNYSVGCSLEALERKVMRLGKP